MAASTKSKQSGKILTEDTINPAYKRIVYGIRGPIEVRSQAIEKELAQGVEKPFQEIIKHIGDPQGLEGQKPITFFRQVLCLATYPELMEDSRFPSDVKHRVEEYLASMRGRALASYTSSQGLKIVRQQIADYISERDGYPADDSNIYLTNGGCEAIRICLKAFMTPETEGPGRAGVMTPIPQYPMYSARLLELNAYQIPYYLDEDNNWQLEMNELHRALDAARPNCVPKALVIVNPGNPTGQVLSYQNIHDIIVFCHQQRLVLFADEVYQENIYDDDSKFHSCRKVLHDMGPEVYNDFQLISLHCSAKGYYGECSLRGGYFELHGFDEAVKSIFLKRLTLYSCPNIYGQLIMGLVCKPPRLGEPSYELFLKEKTAIHESMKQKAKMTTELFNSIEGMKCNKVQGAMYAYPKIHLPNKAIEAAKARGMTPNEMYVADLLEATGIFVVSGTSMGQKEGTFHFRITTIPPMEKTLPMFERIKKFHEDFMNKYRD